MRGVRHESRSTTERSESFAPAVYRPLALAIGVLAHVLATGCTTEPIDPCVGDGDPDLSATPTLFSYPALADDGGVPIYLPAQGGVFTELDIEISGVAPEELSTLTTIVRLEGAEVLTNQTSMNLGEECQDDGSLLLENFPIELDGLVFYSLDELDGREAAFVFTLQLKGDEPSLTREFDLTLERRTLN